MSGCAIQHRTLRELRIGIKTPRPSPRLHLPDRFAHATTELEDGTVVIVEDEYHADRRAIQTQVEARTLPVASVLGKGVSDGETEDGEILTAREANERAQREDMAHPDPSAVDQRPVSRAERRRLIREELWRLSHVEGPGYQRRKW